MPESRLFASGDPHGYFHRIGLDQFEEGAGLSRDDILIYTGDVGIGWDGSDLDRLYCEFFESLPFTVAFVDGNHDNFGVLEKIPVTQQWGGRVRQVLDNVFWLQRGEVFLLGERRCFTFGGARSTDQHRRRPGDWWPQEQPSCAEFDRAVANLERHNWCVDYVFTHTCPYSQVLDFMPRADRLPSYGKDQTERMLEDISSRLSFNTWYFGHLHMDHREGQYHCLFRSIVEIP